MRLKSNKGKAAISKPKAAVKRKKVLSQETYDLTMQEIDRLMKLGEENLTAAQQTKLYALADLVERYEDLRYPLPGIYSLPDIIRRRLAEMGINQVYASTLLGVSNAKFSLIMNGKQRPDIGFIKGVHDQLKVDAQLIMNAI